MVLRSYGVLNWSIFSILKVCVQPGNNIILQDSTGPSKYSDESAHAYSLLCG